MGIDSTQPVSSATLGVPPTSDETSTPNHSDVDDATSSISGAAAADSTGPASRTKDGRGSGRKLSAAAHFGRLLAGIEEALNLLDAGQFGDGLKAGSKAIRSFAGALSDESAASEVETVFKAVVDLMKGLGGGSDRSNQMDFAGHAANLGQHAKRAADAWSRGDHAGAIVQAADGVLATASAVKDELNGSETFQAFSKLLGCVREARDAFQAHRSPEAEERSRERQERNAKRVALREHKLNQAFQLQDQMVRDVSSLAHHR